LQGCRKICELDKALLFLPAQVGNVSLTLERLQGLLRLLQTVAESLSLTAVQLIGATSLIKLHMFGLEMVDEAIHNLRGQDWVTVTVAHQNKIRFLNGDDVEVFSQREYGLLKALLCRVCAVRCRLPCDGGFRRTP
jgi:hypothetical protein